MATYRFRAELQVESDEDPEIVLNELYALEDALDNSGTSTHIRTAWIAQCSPLRVYLRQTLADVVEVLETNWHDYREERRVLRKARANGTFTTELRQEENFVQVYRLDEPDPPL